MTLPLLSVSVLVPIVGALLSDRAPERSAARRVGIRALATTGVLGLLDLVLFDSAAHGPQLLEETPAIPGLGVRWALGVDGLSVLAVPGVALLGAAVLVAAPRGELTTRSVCAVQLVIGGALGGVLALDPALYFAFFVLTLAAGRALVPPSSIAARQLYTVSAGIGTLALAPALGLVHAAGLTLGTAGATGAATHALPLDTQGWVLGLTLVAVAARMGVMPFQSWLPASLRDGQTALAVTVVAGTSLGLSLVARLPLSIAPDASATLMEVLVVLGIGSALHGAFVGLGRDDLRSAVGAVVSSQSALMLVGVASLADPGASGALLQGLATALPATGLLLTLGALHARTGTVEVTRLGGLAKRMPRTTAAYFVFSIALVGFPGSLAFISEDLLLHGLISTHPAVALALLAVTALNGLTVLRGGIRAFLGPPRDELVLDDLSPRERGTAFVLAIAIAITGIAPEPLLGARRSTTERMVESVTSSP